MTFDDPAGDRESRFLDAELETRFPDLTARLVEERRLWAPDPVGGDILLADIFVPYLIDAVRELPKTEAVVAAATAWIEVLAASADHGLRTAARISILQALEDRPGELAVLVPRLGQAARSMLPTRPA